MRSGFFHLYFKFDTILHILTSGASTKVCMNFLMGCPLFESSPMTCTTTPSLRVAWASTWRILVWHSLNCSDITFLCISYRQTETFQLQWLLYCTLHPLLTWVSTKPKRALPWGPKEIQEPRSVFHREQSFWAHFSPETFHCNSSISQSTQTAYNLLSKFSSCFKIHHLF